MLSVPKGSKARVYRTPDYRLPSIYDRMEGHTAMAEINKAGPAADAAATPAGRKLVSPSDFITTWPLFVVAQVESFRTPERLTFECPGVCERETTWQREYEPMNVDGDPPSDAYIYSVAYGCVLCGKEVLTVFYRHEQFEQRLLARPANNISFRGGAMTPPPPPKSIPVLTGIVKVGQYPAPTVDIPKGLQKALGKDGEALYRKALISRNSGFGLAAVGYMRRVVEDKTNELIEVAAKYAEEFGAEPNVVATIRQAKSLDKYTPYEDKLKIAATVFPATLKVGDINPLQVLFSSVSKGLHGLSEKECIEIADEIRAVFEYVFENLKAQIASRHAFFGKDQETHLSACLWMRFAFLLSH